MRQRNQVIRTLGWPRPEKQTIHRCALPVAGLRRPQRAMAAAVRRAGRTGAAAAGRSGLPANGDGGFHLYAGRVPEGRTGEYRENSRRVPTLRAVRAAQKGSKQTTQGDNVVVLAVGEIVPGVEQGLRGLLEGVRNVGTEVGATSPMLAASAVVASGGRLVSAAAATTVVASDLPTSCRWLAKAFEPAAVAAVSSAAGGIWMPSAAQIRASVRSHEASLRRCPRACATRRRCPSRCSRFGDLVRALYGDRSKRIGVLPDNGAS